jgi:hypothetical protein
MRNTWKALKCDAREGWRRSVGPMVWERSKGREDPKNNKKKDINDGKTRKKT